MREVLVIGSFAGKPDLKYDENAEPIRYFPKLWVRVQLPTKHFCYFRTVERDIIGLTK